MTFLLCVTFLVAQPAPADIAASLDTAARTYDIAGVEALLPGLEALPASETTNALLTRGQLLCAELQRITFEEYPESAVKERREMGKLIDAHAGAGLLAVEKMENSSEKYRMKADLIGTRIRSNYRAGKMKGEMKSAVDEALRLDPANPRAMVSSAKMLIFNPNASPQELREGATLLVRALEIDPSLEQARLLQAHTRSLLGEREKAVALWDACLRTNPDCAPARRALATKDAAGENGAPNVK